MLTAAAGAAWGRYLIRATAFDLPWHLYLPIAVVLTTMAAAFVLFGQAGRFAHVIRGALVMAAGWAGVAFVWFRETSSLNRDLVTGLLVLASSCWIGGLALMAARSVNPSKMRPALKRRGVPFVGTVLVGFGLAATAVALNCVIVDGLDGQGQVMLLWQRGARAAPVDAGPASGAENDLEPATVEGSVAEQAPRRDFPSFRYDGTGRVPYSIAADAVPQMRWRAPVGEGWGGVVVMDDRVFSVDQWDGQEVTRCLRLSDGTTVWTASRDASFTRPLSGAGPRATPVAWPGHIATLGADGVLVCRSSDGKLLWQTHILKDAKAENTRHGVVASPLLIDDMLIVAAGGTQRSAIAAYSADSGELRWQAGVDEAGYSSPMRISAGGQPMVAVLHRHSFALYSLEGHMLGSYAYENQDETNAIQPVFADGGVLLTSGYGRRAELVAWTPPAGHGSADAGSTASTGSTAKWTLQNRWSAKRPQTKFSSAVLANNGEMVFALDQGVLCCLDLATGKLLWKEGRYGHGQLLLASNGTLVIQSEDGDIALAVPDAAGRHEKGRWPALNRRTWNAPCLAGSMLIVRNDRELACLEWTAPNARSDGSR